MPLGRNLLKRSLAALAMAFSSSSVLLVTATAASSAPLTSGPAITTPTATMPATTSTAPVSQSPAATQAGVVTIESDRQQADNGTGIVTAVGNVRIVYPDRKVLATSRQAQYFSREGRVVLSGDVQVVQDDGSRLLAEQVIYDVSRERVDARPIPGAQVLSIVRLRRSAGPASSASPLLPAP
ncbi:MAG: LPS-assembly protein LptD [Cyanobacteriota bacterium]